MSVGAHPGLSESAGYRAAAAVLGMHRFEWPDDEPVEFHLGHGDMIRLLRDCGFEIEDLHTESPARLSRPGLSRLGDPACGEIPGLDTTERPVVIASRITLLLVKGCLCWRWQVQGSNLGRRSQRKPTS